MGPSIAAAAALLDGRAAGESGTVYSCFLGHLCTAGPESIRFVLVALRSRGPMGLATLQGTPWWLRLCSSTASTAQLAEQQQRENGHFAAHRAQTQASCEPPVHSGWSLCLCTALHPSSECGAEQLAGSAQRRRDQPLTGQWNSDATHRNQQLPLRNNYATNKYLSMYTIMHMWCTWCTTTPSPTTAVFNPALWRCPLP